MEVRSLGWCKLGRRELGTWISVSARKSYESFSADWFGKPINALELSLWIHSPGSRVTLLLRFGVVVSTVGWNVLSMYPVDVIFYKDNFSLLWNYLSIHEYILLCIYLSFN